MASKLDPETKRRKSVCGTQRYMAPEMKAKELYNCSVDWYSLGKLILDCQGRSAHAERVNREWSAAHLDSLVDGLLVKDPTKRLACRAAGIEELQAQPFFRGIDWAVVDMRKAASPLKREWCVPWHPRFRPLPNLTSPKPHTLPVVGSPGQISAGDEQVGAELDVRRSQLADGTLR